MHVKTNREFNARIEDNVNTEVNDYYITSDANGNFVKTQSNYLRGTQIATLPSGGTSFNDSQTSWISTPVTFDIPNGRWSVQGTFLLKCSNTGSFSGDNNTQLDVVMSFASSGTTPSSDIEGNTVASSVKANGVFEGIVYSPVPHGIATGNIIINNTSGAKKTYTMIVKVKSYSSGSSVSCNISNVGSNNDKQNILYAIPL